METGANIARFDQYTGQIFAALYQLFPVPSLLKTEDFVESARFFDGQLGYERASEESQFFCHTVEWLERAGYVDIAGIDGTKLYAHGVVLTAKGLEVLNIQPDNLNQAVSLGGRMTEAAKSEGSEMLRGLVREALSTGARMMVYGS